ncbi:hypothetical protein DI270_003045 [Microbispora triticiradicis]|uniref:DUF1828 domain-containing protein n=1 Tax=Microbispora triticiradicis TaxID=2200763 RepID=A0ABX9LR24_9ACTN|nr:hypothetical protein [Microbispora triticiradicis]RGA06474.1 hypothetical protein DI270_003045 [Microbispora triticiradicis]GLW22264.1 hypothetical protein Mame01_23070 [Microbispora amethystogenes]
MISFDGTFYTIADPLFEVTIPAWEGYEPDTADEADATITFPDGSRRYATFMTLDVVQKLMNKNARTGESLGGRYFWCSDLIIIRDVGFEGMAAAIRDLIESGEIEQACGLLDPPDDAGEQRTL